jgi:acyl-CoA dehydrogenase
VLVYRAPIEEYLNILDCVLEVDRFEHLAPIGTATQEIRAAVLEGAARIAETVLLPQNAIADQEGCTFDHGEVRLPAGFKGAYETLVRDGWCGLGLDVEHGGQGLPKILADAVREIQIAANMNLAGYLQLTESVYLALRSHGTKTQQSIYLPKLASGEWTGAMHLTEAHAGSDLGLIRTRAEPAGDGNYRISGAKIFISCAEHDMAANSVNLVLARIVGAPAGTRGTSLFLVPKFLPDEDNMLGRRNDVHLMGLEHKLGLHASATGTITYENATGLLVGKAGEGLKAMFTMVNETRLSVGLQGLAIAEIAYQNATAYAAERIQGRAPEGARHPDCDGDPISVHPDIGRRLTEMRAFIEAARCLALWTSLQLDIARHDPQPDRREQARKLAELMTPVIKAHYTDRGFAIADDAIQVYGGHGYIREHGIEQLMRDVRVTRIYEGTNAILALDLVRRRLGGAANPSVKLFFSLVAQAVEGLDPAVAGELRGRLSLALADLQTATDWCIDSAPGSKRDLAAAAHDYLELFGLVALGWAWARLAATAQRRLATAEPDTVEFHLAKLATARFYAERVLTRSCWLREQIVRGEHWPAG